VPSIWDAALRAEPTPHVVLDDDGLDAALRVMGEFADMRSPFRAGHSAGVAALVEGALRAAGASDEDVALGRRAALVHDVGMCGVPAGVVEKRGRLQDAEREAVRMHSYLTERVLQRPATLQLVGEVASTAHERVDGSGYHRRAPRGSLGEIARLLAAADALRAMFEARPHRSARTLVDAERELRADVSAGRLDARAVDAVLAAAGRPRAHLRRVEHPGGLSDREVEVLRLVARGMTNKQVAAALSLSAKTVGNHLQRIYDRLDVTTRAAATLWAVQNELV
jgi:HD-GYP domain-containing protein (c-di-GMP phosphodiesterase class II)